MSPTTEDSQKKNSKEQSIIIKRIRLCDKNLRERLKDLPLFKVTFRYLRDLETARLLEIETWYVELTSGENFNKLRRIYNENTPEYWRTIPNHFEEHEKMRYRQQIFISEARRTMPEEINPRKKT